MKAVLQRVSSASVRIGDEVVGKIGQGLAVLLGVVDGDGVEEADFLAEKAANLRIFGDGQCDSGGKSPPAVRVSVSAWGRSVPR